MTPNLVNSDTAVRWHFPLATVRRIAEARLPTEFGEFRIVGYRSLSSTEEFVALVMGAPRPESPTLIRLHSQCMTGDVFRSVRCDCGRQLHAAMKLIAAEGCGAILYQQQEGRASVLSTRFALTPCRTRAPTPSRLTRCWV